MFPCPDIRPNYRRSLDALQVLEVAAEECAEFEMRRREVFEALAEIDACSPGKGATAAFRRALEVPDPAARYEAMCQAMRLIRRQLGA
jgi:hypothetical protein